MEEMTDEDYAIMLKDAQGTSSDCFDYILGK